MSEDPVERQKRINEALTRYANDEAADAGNDVIQSDMLAVAQTMGLPVETERDKFMAINSVRNLLSGSAPKQSRAIVPNPHGITTVHGDGRTQIPHKIREYLNLVDGSYVFWYEINGMIVMSGKQIGSDWMKMALTFDAAHTKSRLRP